MSVRELPDRHGLKKIKKYEETTMLINVIVILTSLLIVVTKFFDCYTTYERIIRKNEGINLESNPIVRMLMYKLNSGTAVIIFVFFVTLFIVSFVTYMIYRVYPYLYMKVAYIVIGLFVAIVQAAVVRTNISSKPNIITKKIFKIHSNMQRLLKI